MTDPSNGSKIFVFSKDSVRRAAKALVEKHTHEHFPGYLAMLRAHANQSGSPARSADIKEIYQRYLKIEGGEQPYVLPFTGGGDRLKLYNKNVAGSYSPSSIRQDAPFQRVVDISGSGRETEYKLKSDHANLALTHFLQGNALPIVSTTVFLYRDYGFELQEPKIKTVVDLFRSEFALRETVPAEKASYDILFHDDSVNFSDDDLIEFKEE